MFGLFWLGLFYFDPVVMRHVSQTERFLMKTDTPALQHQQKTTVAGTRMTQGNAVECPTIRDDSGKLHAVSFLSAAIPVGARVSVSGFYAVTTKCVGRVLVVEKETPLSE